MRLRPLLALSVAFTASCAHGPKFLPDNREAAIARTEKIGRALYAADKLAAAGSDAYLAHGWKPNQSPVQGYVVLPGTNRVVFLGEVNGALKRFATVDLTSAPQVVEETAEPSHDEARLFRAVMAARVQFRPICPRPYNPIAIADPDQPWTLVYFLASTNDPGEAIMTGHVRGIVSNDDGKVLEVAPLSKSCMIQPRASGPGKVIAIVGMAITHPLGPLPTEGHVYAGLSNQMPLFVLGNDNSMWIVEAGSISSSEAN